MTAYTHVQAVEEKNRQTGARVNPDATPDDMMNNPANTRGLMTAVNQLPALIERKRTIEKHVSILHKLMAVWPLSPPINLATYYGDVFGDVPVIARADLFRVLALLRRNLQPFHLLQWAWRPHA